MLALRLKTLFALPLAVALFAAASPRAYTQTASTTPDASPSTSSDGQSQSDSDLRSTVEQLKQLLQAQQRRIDALEAEHQPAPAQPPAASPAAPTPAPVQSTDTTRSAPAETSIVGQNLQGGSSDERVRNLEKQIKGIGPISFSGDVRLRGEPFFGGPSDESLDRMRARIRVRFNAIADLGSQFRTGITLASGDVNDPTSTNSTLTGFYTRKPIALDQAFVEFTPKQFKPLTLVGGKFRYPWYNTELTWDKDLNPEGAAQTLAFKLDSPVLKRFALVGFELPFAEVAEGSPTDKRVAQQVTYGGQIQTTWQVAPRVTLSAYSGFYNFHGADSIALALARASAKNPQTPFAGILPLTSGNTVQDSIYTTTASNVVTIGGTSYPTGVTTITNAQFASRFALFDNIARIDIDTGHDKVPVAFIGDYVQNTGACGNLRNIIPVPANTDTLTYKQSVNAPCASNQRRGYWAEARVGRLQRKGDFQVGYTRIYIEREAVLGNFNYSDIRQGTNVTQHRFDFFYQFDPNVQLGFTSLVGRPLGTTEPWLTRLQFDSIFIF